MAKVTNKQYTTTVCFVCGEKNPKGLKMNFYETENGEVVGLFNADEHYCGYSKVLHGGVSATILDETIGRAIMITDPKVLGMTLELNIKYKKPAPGTGIVKAVGRITRKMGNFFEGSGEILLPDGTPCVTAKGVYIMLDEKKTAELADASEFIYHNSDLTEI